MKKYISGKEAFYDEDRKLHYCYVGFDQPGKPLEMLVFGNTARRAIYKAAMYAQLLNELLASEERTYIVSPKAN